MRAIWVASLVSAVVCSGCAEMPLDVELARGLTLADTTRPAPTSRPVSVTPSAAQQPVQEAFIPAVLLAEHQQMTTDYARLVSEQMALVTQLETSVRELQDTCNQLSADFERIDPRQEWHERMIGNNRTSYRAVCEMLLSLTEEQFPTQRVWYGDAWQKLTAPYRVGQFPRPNERDQLVQLLHEIMTSEQKRAASLADSAAAEGTVVPIGYCLGPRWDQLYRDLCALKY